MPSSGPTHVEINGTLLPASPGAPLSVIDGSSDSYFSPKGNRTHFGIGAPEPHYLKLRAIDGRSLALIIDQTEAIAPAGELNEISPEDRFVLATLARWAREPVFRTAGFVVALIAHDLTALNARLEQDDQIKAVEVTG